MPRGPRSSIAHRWARGISAAAGLVLLLSALVLGQQSLDSQRALAIVLLGMAAGLLVGQVLATPGPEPVAPWPPHARERPRHAELPELPGRPERGVPTLSLASLTGMAILADATPDTLLACDENGTITAVNARCSEMFQHVPADLLGQPPTRLFGNEDRVWLVSALTGPRGTYTPAREVTALRKDGTEFAAEVHIGRPGSSSGGSHLGAAVSLGHDFAATRHTLVIRDISERKKVERLKNEFVSMVSHELRTPLTSIRGSLALRAGGGVGSLPSRAHTLVSIAERNSERLLRLINDLLDIAKIESGTFDFTFKVFPLQRLLEHVVEVCVPMAEQRQVRLSLRPPGPGVRLYADEDRLAQVVTNLVSNAVKFSPPATQVEVAAELRPGGIVRVSVSDSGPGVPVGFRARLFEKFAQADSSDSRWQGGTGLGLSISRSIIDRLGGAIGYSPGEDSGSVFFFELSTWEASDPGMVVSSGVVGRPLLLIVGSDEGQLGTLEKLLVPCGFAVRHASCCSSARARVQSEWYAGAIVTLPRSAGDQMALLSSLRGHSLNPALPMVAYSGLPPGSRLLDAALNDVAWIHTSPGQGSQGTRGASEAETTVLNALNRVLLGARSSPQPVLHLVTEGRPRHAALEAVLKELGSSTAVHDVTQALQALSAGRYDLILVETGGTEPAPLEPLTSLAERPPCVLVAEQPVPAAFAARADRIIALNQLSPEAALARVVSVLCTPSAQDAVNHARVSGR
jgi:PAS domain S-box-containing protein